MSGNGNVDQNSADSNWDYLHVSVLRASLEEPKTGASNGGCCYFHPYVILGGFQLLDLIIMELKSHMTCHDIHSGFLEH